MMQLNYDKTSLLSLFLLSYYEKKIILNEETLELP